MLLIGFMAVLAPKVLVEYYFGYVLAFAGIVTVLALLWRETGMVDPDHAKYSKPYSFIYFVLALFLLGSVFLDAMYRMDYLIIAVLLLLLPNFIELLSTRV